MTAIDIRRALGTLLVASAGGWLLLQLPAPAALPTQLGSLTTWWDAVGTDAAAFAFARLIMLGTCGYVAAISTLALVAAPLQVFRIRLPWHHLAVPSLRRHLAGAAIVAVTLAPGLANAQDAGQFTAGDIGRSPTASQPVEPFILADIGAIEEPVQTTPSTPDTRAIPAFTNTWTVEPKDHLWGIAKTQVNAARPKGVQTGASNSVIATYWLRLIDANATVLGGNPDVIVAGQILTLPPLVAQ